MTFHPMRRVHPANGLMERWCPYCRAVAPQFTPHADWAAAHRPCQEAAEKLAPDELIRDYISTRNTP